MGDGRWRKRKEWKKRGCWRGEESKEEIWGTSRDSQELPPSIRTPRDPHPLAQPIGPLRNPTYLPYQGRPPRNWDGGREEEEVKGIAAWGKEGDH